VEVHGRRAGKIKRRPGSSGKERATMAQQPKQVIMYTTSWCPDCRVAKRYLDSRGVPYTEVNIERTPGAAEQVERWSGGYRTVPTFDIDGRIVVDFNRRELDRALAD
jgi:mycoredoxin